MATSNILNEYLEISPAQKADFNENGHLLLRNVLGKDDVEAYHRIINAAATKYNEEKRRLEDRDTYGKAFLQIMNLWRNDEEVKRFVLAKRFAKIAADLLGVDNVRLYHDQALYKEAGGGPTPWHQDQNYWPLDTPKTVTMWMPLVDIPTVEMGMLTFASGSHKKNDVNDLIISDESEQTYADYVRTNNFPVSRADYMHAGDATFHLGYTIHNAPGNSSDTLREVMTIIYFADGARITPPKHQWQENDRQQWLMGKEPGSLADAEINPLLLP